MKEVYTYRGGQKLQLKKRDDQFVVRRLPDELSQEAMSDNEQVSSASTRVKCESDELESLMQDARNLAPTHHAYEVEGSGEEFLITDRIIVTFAQTPDAEKAGAFAGRYALEIVHKFSDRKYLFRLTNATGKNPVKLVVELTENDADVALVEHDLNQRIQTFLTVPDDPFYASQWHLHRHFQHQQYDHRSSANCEQAWQALGSFGSADVVVGVTDDGCKLDHVDFNSTGKFAGWGYFKSISLIRKGDAGADGNQMYQSGSNHGTSCAGVIAAETDGEMTVGAAPGCRLLPVKWESSGASLFISDTKLLIALDYMADKVDVLSNSWGASPTMTWSSDVIDRITELARSGGRRGKGIVFLWAAGNENCPIQYQAGIKVPYTSGWSYVSGSWQWTGVRTALKFEHNLVGIPGLMHVAALASTGQRSHYSNYGPGVDICAPSNNVHSYSRIVVNGLGITTTVGDNSQVTSSFGGTSSATPLTAGIAALVISANPMLSALEVVALLKQTASKDLNLTPYPKTPSAVYDPDTSWDVSPIAPFDDGAFINTGSVDGTWSPWFGHGKVDALAAVQSALDKAGLDLRTVRIENDTDIAIPDLDPAGISSQIVVEETGRIQTLKVDVDIQHTYLGDLVVRLFGPNGRQAVLHQRAGGATDNLKTTFTQANAPELGNFVGQDIRGTWRLEVADVAKLDSGILKSWALEAEVPSTVEIKVESLPGLKIPDNVPGGVTDTITISERKVIRDISVEVDITHTWIGDLHVELSKDGSAGVLLHGRAGREADNILHTYRPADLPDLAQFLGKPANGEWRLKVSDNAYRDIGKLNRWALIIVWGG
jgi:subtilisin-like proprotein convertase family protein/subtilisin family serine protease